MHLTPGSCHIEIITNGKEKGVLSISGTDISGNNFKCMLTIEKKGYLAHLTVKVTEPSSKVYRFTIDMITGELKPDN